MNIQRPSRWIIHRTNPYIISGLLAGGGILTWAGAVVAGPAFLALGALAGSTYVVQRWRAS